MTIKVKLFYADLMPFTRAQRENQDSVDELERDMNKFLTTLKDNQVKKIYVALNDTQRMGLVEYTEEVKITSATT